MQSTWLAASGTASSVIYHICFFGAVAAAAAGQKGRDRGSLTSSGRGWRQQKGATCRKTSGCICLSLGAIVRCHLPQCVSFDVIVSPSWRVLKGATNEILIRLISNWIKVMKLSNTAISIRVNLVNLRTLKWGVLVLYIHIYTFQHESWFTSVFGL